MSTLATDHNNDNNNELYSIKSKCVRPMHSTNSIEIILLKFPIGILWGTSRLSVRSLHTLKSRGRILTSPLLLLDFKFHPIAPTYITYHTNRCWWRKWNRAKYGRKIWMTQYFSPESRRTKTHWQTFKHSKWLRCAKVHDMERDELSRQDTRCFVRGNLVQKWHWKQKIKNEKNEEINWVDIRNG